MQAHSGDWSIGHLARASGVPVRTIRFYSDAGLLPPGRTGTGHRRYTPVDLARLQLIRSLRALDMDLPAITELLTGAGDLQETLRGHTRTLEVRLHAVQRQLAVARAAAESTPERTLTRLHALTRIEAAERDRLLHRFWDEVLPADPGPDTDGSPDPDAEWFRTAGMPQLPADPTGQQLDAWLELTELAADPGFRAATKVSATWFVDHARPDVDPRSWQRQLEEALELAQHCCAGGVEVDDPRARPAVEAYVAAHATAFGQDPSPAFRTWLHQQLDALTDPRAERWWHLVAQVQPCIQAPRRSPDTIVWLHRALAHWAATQGPPVGSDRQLRPR